jgi:sulfur-oxidizing protein SoxZ
MADAKPRVKVPKTVKKGEPFEIKTVISHVMESGQRKDKSGAKIPRQIIKKFVVLHNGNEIMSADWHPAVSANPYMEFYATVDEGGTMEFQWHDDNGEVYKTTSDVKVG